MRQTVGGVIEDSKGDVMAVETTEPSVWDDLVSLRNSQTEMWVGGVVEEYGNYWGFLFRPDTMIAEVTVEGAQSNIRGISGDLSYWMNVWAKETYVFANVRYLKSTNNRCATTCRTEKGYERHQNEPSYFASAAFYKHSPRRFFCPN